MKIKISWFIIMLFVMMNQLGFAQNIIKGRVTDKTNSEALFFANVYLPEHNKGRATDKNGEFVLTNLSKGELKIQFSYVGYKTVIKTIFVKNTETILNIEMEPTVLQAEEVVISGGTYSTQHENAIKIELIKNKDIASIGTPTFTEAIANVPGVDMIAKGTGVAKPVIRGLSMTNILMLNNGVKMENFQFSENHPFIIDEFGIDRIEIIKGPASLLYGSDAVGGVINVIKEKPAPIGKILGDYNMQYHSNTQGVVSNLGIKGSSENIFWGLRGGIKSHTDYRDGNGDYIPNTRFNENSLKANVGINKSFGLFRLYYDYNRPKLGMCVGDAVPLTTENGRKNKLWYQDLTNHIISTRNTLFLGKYKIDLNAAYQMNNRRLQTDENKPFFEMVDMDLNTFSYEVKSYLPSTANSEYIVGLQGANKTNRNHEAPNHILPDANVNDFSIFGLAQYTFFEKLKTQAGVRYDFRSISTEAETNKEAVNADYGNVSASLGATYEVNKNILLRANLASAYRTPNIAELTENGMHGVRYEQGNSKLKSQRSYEADLNAHFHSKFVMVDVSGFYNSINDYIFIAPTNDTIVSGDKIYRYSQTNSEIYGSELAVNVLPFDWLNFKTTYGYLIGKQDNGTNLPFIPQNKLRFELKFQKQKLAFLKNTFFKVGGLFATKQNNPAMFETETDSYFLLNAGIGTEIKWANQMVSLSVQANNLLNETYIDHLSTLKGMGYYNIGKN
ncbi:MAG: TonB-dependent receptor, partial [Candidatus Delongbacteria bacterium]|nr:TonB-dependent receptor [Candidatus Delongbacteria bacterium]